MTDQNLDINIPKLTSVHELTVREIESGSGDDDSNKFKVILYDILHKDRLWMTLTINPSNHSLQAIWDFAVRLENNSQVMGAKLKTKEIINALTQSL